MNDKTIQIKNYELERKNKELKEKLKESQKQYDEQVDKIIKLEKGDKILKQKLGRERTKHKKDLQEWLPYEGERLFHENRQPPYDGNFKHYGDLAEYIILNHPPRRKKKKNFARHYDLLKYFESLYYFPAEYFMPYYYPNITELLDTFTAPNRWKVKGKQPDRTLLKNAIYRKLKSFNSLREKYLKHKLDAI